MPHDDAVSELIGALVLIAILSLVFGIIGVQYLSAQRVSEIPAANIEIFNESRNIYIVHNGGDTLKAGGYKILVNGVNRTSYFTLSGSNSVAGTLNFTIGQTIYSNGSFLGNDMPYLVQLVGTESGGSGALIYSNKLP
jgi:hypothetical protein